LMFSGGHTAFEGEALVRADLCAEALRLVRLMLRHEDADEPATRALAALMCLHAARLPARIDDEGGLVPLDAQDRSLWNRSLMAEGFHHLERAADGPLMSRYHLEAGIAAAHAAAPSVAGTDWGRIVDLYDLLMADHPSPVVALNRAVAVGRALGPEEGLAAARAAAESPVLAEFHLRPAVLGAFLEELGAVDAATAAFREAISLCRTSPERIHMERRLERVPTGSQQPR
jgi:predicted RNA polymerase sigma factor